jgi:transposase-like protein
MNVSYYAMVCPVCGSGKLESRGNDKGEGEWETMEFYYCPNCEDQFTVTYHAGAIYEKMQESVWNMMKRKREQKGQECDDE